MDQKLLHSLIAGIYDAALEPLRWPTILEQLAGTLGASAVSIAVLDGRGLPRNFLAFGIPAELQRLFLTKYSRPELNVSLCELASYSVGVIVRQPEAEWIRFTRSGMYEELYYPQGILGQANSILERGANCNIGVGMLFQKGGGLAKISESPVAKVINMHMRRALQLSWQLESLNQQNQLLTESLDRVSSVGIVLLDAAGTVILANRTAEEMARARDGVTIGPRGISASTPDLTNRLEMAVAAAVRTRSGASFSPGAHVRLSRPSGRRPLLVIVSPVGGVEWPLLSRRPAAIVLIADPERELLLPPERIAQLHGLTRRESELAAVMAQGIDLSEAADRLGMSRGTAETHLKRILEKTDTHRQAELVSLLLRGLAGFAG